MVDLQLLITNLKSCAYVKKMNKKKVMPNNNPFLPVQETNSESNSDISVEMPVQDVIKVYNSPASVLYTNNPSNNANVMLGLTEPFNNSNEDITPSFFSSFTFKLIVVILVILFIMKL
jgi:hypothetical protein